MPVYKTQPILNGQGGKDYTAGNGIQITDENIINADIKVLEVENITELTNEQCESLNSGDVVVKLTSNQKHTYTVSYKEAGVGMCLTYVDASVSETVSYDYVTDAWVYNSTDVTELGGGGSQLYYLTIYYPTDASTSYPTSCTLQVEDNSLSTYTDLVNYLKTRGFIYDDTLDRYISHPASGFSDYTSAVSGIFVHENTISVIRKDDTMELQNVAEFSITYLGQD